MSPCLRVAASLLGLIATSLLAVGCGRSSERATALADGAEAGASSDQAALAVGYLVPRPIGAAAVGQPWVTDLAIADLDADGLLDVVVAEGRLNTVSWIRQSPLGSYRETTLESSIAGPAHVEAVDIDGDGDNDLLVAGMGIVTPNDQKIGTVNILENVGGAGFRRRLLAEGVDRVTDVQAADFDGDGDLDLAVAAFGYFEGEVFWMENRGAWRFEPRSLLGLAGAIHAPAADIDGDGDVDIVALVSQDWEEIHVFENDGAGNFVGRVAYGSTNKDYGSSGIALTDLDGDGHIDIAYSNGDGFDYATPGSRSWHGLQWLRNDGRGRFAYRRVGDLPGAYSPVAADLDGDGDRDLVAVSGFNDWSRPDAIALACFERTADGDFQRRVLAYAPTHLVVVDAADMDGDGRIELVTGGFCFYPPFDRASRVTVWERPAAP